MIHDLNYRPTAENRQVAQRIVDLLEKEGPQNFFQRLDVMFLAVVMACGLAGYHQILERLLNRLNPKSLSRISQNTEKHGSGPET